MGSARSRRRVPRSCCQTATVTETTETLALCFGIRTEASPG
jgi:hypothetical protein